MGITSTSDVMLFFPQKSSISWVSGRPPIGEPERLRRPKDEPENGDGQRLLRRAHHHHVAIAAQKAEIGVNVVIGGNSVENEVKAAGMLRHLIGVSRDDHLIGAEPKRIISSFQAK